MLSNKKYKILFFVFMLVVVIIYFTAFTVSEREYAIVTQFGKPVKVVENAGLNFKLPGFIQTVNKIDKSVNIFNTQPIELLLNDKNPIIFSCYLFWKVHDPLRFFFFFLTREIANQKLSDMINSQLGSTLSDYTIENIININPEMVKLKEIEAKILESSNEKVEKEYGIHIISAGIRRINYPSIVANSVYQRMRAEREKEAKRYRAEGQEEAAKMKARTDREVSFVKSNAYREAEIIKGKGDKEAIRTYGQAYSRDPELFKFMKSLEALNKMLEKKGTLILSTKSEVFKYLNSMGMKGK